MLTWQWRRFPELSGDDVYDMLALRARIFAVEQACAYLDPDGADRHAWHLHGRDTGGVLRAYLRALDPGVNYTVPSIGRVVVDASLRGTGQGHALVAEGLRRCDQAWPGRVNRISAQAHLQGFYRRHGYVAFGEGYLEDGIPHIAMERQPS